MAVCGHNRAARQQTHVQWQVLDRGLSPGYRPNPADVTAGTKIAYSDVAGPRRGSSPSATGVDAGLTVPISVATPMTNEAGAGHPLNLIPLISALSSASPLLPGRLCTRAHANQAILCRGRLFSASQRVILFPPWWSRLAGRANHSARSSGHSGGHRRASGGWASFIAATTQVQGLKIEGNAKTNPRSCIIPEWHAYKNKK